MMAIETCGGVVRTIWKRAVPALVIAAAPTVLLIGQSSPQTVYGPEDFVRKSSTAVTVSRVFATPAPAQSYAVCIDNGGAQDSYGLTASALVKVDGVNVAVPDDFRPRPPYLSREVTLSGGQHRLDVEIRGAARTGVEIRVVRGGVADCQGAPANRTPEITSSAGTAGTVGTPYGYDVEATDADGDTLTYSLTAFPAGMTINPGSGLIAWTPATAGSHATSVQVSDGRGGTATQSFTITVVQTNRAPVITSSAVLGAQAAQPYVYDVDATDPDGDVLAYALAFGPDGMTIDAATGAISWTPTAQQAGVRSALVQVDDGRGGTDHQGLAIEVQAPVNHAPVAGDDRYEVGLGQTLVVPAPGVLANDSDPDGDGLAAQLVSPPGEGDLVLQPDGGFTYTTRPLVGPGELNPAIEWTQSTFRVAPTSTQIMMTPIVIDANRDGVPEIFVATHAGSSWRSVGLIRALAGGPTPVSNFNLVRLKHTSVQVSSTFSPSYVPERAIDGNLQTSWFTARPDAGAYFQLTLPSAATVRQLRIFGNRQFAEGHDFLSGRFDLFDGSGVVLYSTGSVALPAPERDLTLLLPAPVAGVRRVRFTATGFQTAGDDHGFSEIEIIGDAVADPGTELWSVGGEVIGSTGIAAADIDHDGFAEIVAQHVSGGLVAFEHDGLVKWRSVDLGLGVSGEIEVIGSPSIADLDGDGTAEVVVGAAVLNSDGTLRWKGGSSADTGNNGFGPLSVVADLDLDGRPEILTGKSAYRADGSLYWTSTRIDGFTAVGNFDVDPFPEIVVVSGGSVRLLEHSGQVKWGPVSLPGGGRGGPPTIADVDADGHAEIGVAGSTRFVLFETDGSVKWEVEIQDSSSNVTGSSVFDFEGDGKAEIVYADELYLRILRGSDGAELYKLEKGSATLHEIPTIADVDGDGRAEIVVGANDWSFGQETGLYVIGGADQNWIPTRAIWNQHAYHVTNVRADGTIPATETHHWLVPGLNAFRQNAFAPGDPDRTTSFSYRVGDGDLESNHAVVQITLRQPNSPPEIQEVPGGSAATGIEYLYGATVSDPDLGDTHTFDLIASPAGMTVEPLTGLVRWTPAANQVGNHGVTLRVLDHRGLSDVYSFTVAVGLPIAVPNLTGSSQAAADATIRAAGLTVAPVATQYSTTVPLGNVISQLPLPSTLVAADAPVYLLVSAGLEPVTVPNLSGLSQADATTLLASKGLVLGSVALAPSNTAAPHTVMAQSPLPGSVVGETSAVDITVSTGAAIAVSVSRSVFEAGGSTAFVVEAYDHTGALLSPLPPLTLAILSIPGESAGTAPVIAGNLLTTSADTRGAYTLRATLGSGDTASASFVVSRTGAGGPALYSALGDAIGAMTKDLAALEAAIVSGAVASIPARRDALVATRDSIPLERLAGSTAFTPEGGFAPSLAALTAAGFPETPADVAWNTALRNVIATVKDTEVFLSQLSPAGTQDDDLTLLAFNAQLEARVAALLAIKPTLHGIVKRANVVNQLVSVRIPRLIDAQVSAIDRSLTAQGLARTAESADQFYAGLRPRAAGDVVDPAAFYATPQLVFFTLPSLMNATRIQMDIIKNVYMPVIGELVRGAVTLAAGDLLQSYTNVGSLVSVITASSQTFHFFDVPGSVIEGFGFDSDFPEGNEVRAIGPNTINAFLDMIAPLRDHPESFADMEEMVEFFQGVADNAQAFADTLKVMEADGVLRGCLFDFSSTCRELVFDDGLTSVYSSGSFPAPVLLFVRNVNTGSWGMLIANFFPSDSN
jgi:hypothetical protein